MVGGRVARGLHVCGSLAIHGDKVKKAENCDGCGLCCIRQGRAPYSKEEAKHLPVELVTKLERYMNSVRGRENWRGPCPLYDILNNRCTEYEQRPDACRRYELNGEKCQEMVQVKIHSDAVGAGMKRWQLSLK